mmetsp:Transcript_57522/g.186878  ORF Transcript_57522/g.186878 Transcript_57522/m.186878 type:complete len:206 (+) Transcript_57522:1527-2144(+)
MPPSRTWVSCAAEAPTHPCTRATPGRFRRRRPHFPRGSSARRRGSTGSIAERLPTRSLTWCLAARTLRSVSGPSPTWRRRRAASRTQSRQPPVAARRRMLREMVRASSGCFSRRSRGTPLRRPRARPLSRPRHSPRTTTPRASRRRVLAAWSPWMAPPWSSRVPFWRSRCRLRWPGAAKRRPRRPRPRARAPSGRSATWPTRASS